jgi:hypothetical protein
MIDHSQLISKLQNDFNYSRAGAESLASDVLKMPEILRLMAEEWLNDGTETDYSVEGFSVLGLMEKKGFNYLNALNVVAWLMREPDAAKKALSRPFDRVITRTKK